VIYVCSLSDVSVIMCTDMVNVYNCRSGRIKYPAVYLTNACESRSRPFTDAETRQTPIYKKGQKDDPGNYRSVSLTSVPGKIMEQLILSVLTRHVKDNQGIRPSQHGFMKGRSCLTNLISLFKIFINDLDEGIE